MASAIKYCPTCRYYLYLSISGDDGKTLNRLCRNCGYSQPEATGGLITFTNLEEKVSEGYKVVVNEFTREDPTLPHVNNIKCKNENCPSNKGGATSDVIYIKYDQVNLKFLYICNVCNEQWRSRT
jgi:DNA-directed RNA polymerase subunit M/transcription elongation factor TFIIS